MKYISCEQGTPEWFEARLGRITSSRIADMLARTKTGWGASRANYEADLIVERTTGKTPDGYKSTAMQWGTDTQPQAQRAYQFLIDQLVEEVGFIAHEQYMFGASPDGLVGTEGLVEFKCPLTATHIETLLTGTFPGKYLKQVQWQMFMAERKWCDLVSYHPDMRPRKRMFIKRVLRNDLEIQEIVAHAHEFLKGVEEKVALLDRMYPEEMAA